MSRPYERELCPICERGVPIVPFGSDVPMPFLREDGTGQRWHVGCVEDLVLSHVRRNGGSMAALRVVALVRRYERAGALFEEPIR